MENVEIWDESLQLSFSSSLFNCIKKLFLTKDDLSQYLSLINSILKFFIQTISNDEKHLLEEYLRNFNEIIEFINSKRRIKIEQSVVEMALNLGIFGKSLICRRYSVYFCSSLLRINKNENQNEELNKRLYILSSDSDRIIRQEMAYHMRFILKEMEEANIIRHYQKTVILNFKIRFLYI
jgi:hypothetical protein